jgi:hypothetical protein
MVFTQSTNFPLFVVTIEITFMNTEVIDFIFLVDYLDKCEKTNIMWFFHFVDIPLLCIYVCSRQSKTLKHNFTLCLSTFFYSLHPMLKIFKLYVITCLLITTIFSHVLM